MQTRSRRLLGIKYQAHLLNVRSYLTRGFRNTKKWYSLSGLEEGEEYINYFKKPGMSLYLKHNQLENNFFG